MKNQVKVSTTQQYSDNQGEHIVHLGKLILIEELDPKKKHSLWRNKNGQLLHTTTSTPEQLTSLKPIIISETEEIEKGDWVYHTSRMQLFKVHHFEQQMGKLIVPEDDLELPNDGIKVLVSDCVKVLALPEHFSDKHLQAIVDGKMKDGDEVLVKCGLYLYGGEVKDKVATQKDGYEHRVYFNRNIKENHITLFPVQQSLGEASWNYAVESNESLNTPVKFHRDGLQHKSIRDFKAGAEWAKKNNY